MSRDSEEVQKKFSIGKLISFSIIAASLLFLCAGGVLGYQIISNQNNENQTFAQRINLFNLTGDFGKYIGNVNTPIKGESEGRTNVLLLGINDDPKENGLTDSVLVASYSYAEKKVSIISIPRDLYVFSQNQIEGRINELYPFGRAQKPSNPNYGAEFVTNFLSKELDLPIHYWATINISGAKDLIDKIGGVSVDVENSFTDCEYPNDDYTGYLDCQEFEQGIQQMDGQRAVVYARSRKSLDPLEGSDFARSKRQSNLLKSMAKTIKEKGLITNLTQVNDYLNFLGKNVNTNAKNDEIISGAVMAKDINIENEENFVRGTLSDESNFLCASTTDAGAYVLLLGKGEECLYTLGRDRNNAYTKQLRAYFRDILKATAKENQSVPESTLQEL